MNTAVEHTRNTWISAIRLAAVLSAVAAAVAFVVSSTGDVPQAAVVLPVIVIGFVASWVQTGRTRREVITTVDRAHGIPRQRSLV